MRNEPAVGPAFPADGIKKTGRYATGNTILLVSAALVAAVLIGPLVFSPLFSSLQSGGSSSVPVADSLITKVDANGTTVWQTAVYGYSEFPLEVCPSNDGGLIVAGMFWLPGQKDTSLRVMKLDRNGTLAWDIHREVSEYPETNLGSLQSVLSTAGEYTVIMADGFVIRLDAWGNEVWHHRYPDTVVHTSIPRSDGGFILAGDAHEGSPSEPGWKKFDGWILSADRNGDIAWQKKETGFSDCTRAVLSPEGNLLVSCFVPESDPDRTGNQIVALDPRGTYLWKKNFAGNHDGIIYSMKSPGNGTYVVYLRGEGERKYTLDQQGNSLSGELLPPGPDSYSHEIAPDLAFGAESLAGNRIRVKVTDLFGSGSVFVIGYPVNWQNLSGIYSVNPVSDGGYLVTSSAKR
jgi:hypothetical protein